MRGEKLIYKLTAAGFWVSEGGSGGRVYVTRDDIAAGMKYGKITGLEYHVLLSLMQPPVAGDRIIQLRRLAKDKANQAKFSEEEAYKYLIETFITDRDLERYFYQHMAGVAYQKQWRLKKGIPVLRYLGRVVIAEKMFPWLKTCSGCWGRGEREIGGLIKPCSACTGQRPSEAGRGVPGFIGSGLRELSGRAMGRLLDIDQKSYEETWKGRKPAFDVEFDAQIMTGLAKLADTVYRDRDPRDQDPQESPNFRMMAKKKQSSGSAMGPARSRVQVNHRAGGRQTLTLGGAGC